MATPTITGSVRLSRRPALTVAVAARAPRALTSLVVGSIVVRGFFATLRVAPALFPDEYIYGALGRSLASGGRPLIRGEAAHFPALLAPIAAAPLWGLFSSTTQAYHAVQVENAVFMSLAAIPVYLIARWLDLGYGLALFAAAVALLSPDLAFSGYTLAEPISYPLALTALYAGMRALESPTLARQLAFLGLAGLTCFARVQYVVLLPAFLLAALLMSRRAAFRTHRLPFALVGAGGVVVLLSGSAHILGYYSAVTRLHVGVGLARWALVDVVLLALTVGVALAPGAVAGFLSARGPREAACAVLCGFYATGLLVAAGLYASNGSARFQERYLFSLVPLLAIGFGLYVKHGLPARWAVLVGSAAGIALAAIVPISRYAGGTGPTDSPTLRAVARLEESFGVGTTSLALALYVTVAAALAATIAWRRSGTGIIVALTVLFLCCSSGAATAFDIADARRAQEPVSGQSQNWVDEQHLTGVSAIHTVFSPPSVLLQELYYNRSISRELVLAPAAPTDSFSAPPVRIEPNGELRTPGGVVRTPILFERFGVTAAFDRARLVAQTARFSLWKPAGVPRLRYLETGRFSDGWLASQGELTIYPARGVRLHGVVEMDISLPRGSTATPFRIAGRTMIVRPGLDRRLRICFASRGPWTTTFSAPARFLSDLRAVGIRATAPRVLRGAACARADLRP